MFAVVILQRGGLAQILNMKYIHLNPSLLFLELCQLILEQNCDIIVTKTFDVNYYTKSINYGKT